MASCHQKERKFTSDDEALPDHQERAPGVGDPKQVHMYCKHLVYTAMGEFSLEEIRAAFLEKRMETSCMQKLKEDHQMMERQLRKQREEVAALTKQKLQLQQECQRLKTTAPLEAVKLAANGGPDTKPRLVESKTVSETKCTEMETGPILQKTPESSDTLPPQCTAHLSTPRQISAGVPGATGEVAVNGGRISERGCPSLEDMDAHTTNHVGLSSTTNRKLPPRDMRATYIGPLSLEGICAPSPTVNTKEAMKMVKMMFNQSLGMAWDKEILSDFATDMKAQPAQMPLDFSIYQENELPDQQRGTQINDEKQFPSWWNDGGSTKVKIDVVHTQSQIKPVPGVEVPAQCSQLLGEVNGANPDNIVIPTESDGALDDLTFCPGYSSTRNFTKAGNFIECNGRQSTTFTLYRNEQEAEISPTTSTISPLPQQEMATDTEEVVARPRPSEYMQALRDTSEDVGQADSALHDSIFRNMAKLTSTPFNQLGPAPPMPLPGISFITGNTGRNVAAENFTDQTFGVMTIFQDTSAVYQTSDCSSRQTKPNVGECTQPLKDANQKTALMREADITLGDSIFRDMAKLASTPFNQLGPAPQMPPPGVSFIIGNTGRNVEAEKLTDQTFEVVTVSHSAASTYQGADCAAPQSTTIPASNQVPENSTAPKLANYTAEANNLSPIIECSDESLSSSSGASTAAPHTHQKAPPGADISNTAKGATVDAKFTMSDVIREETEDQVDEQEDASDQEVSHWNAGKESLKSPTLNQTCHEIDVTNYLTVDDDTEDLLSQSIFVSPYNDPFDQALISNLLGRVDIPIEQSRTYHRIHARMPHIKAKNTLQLGGDMYTVIQHLAQGAFATVYTVHRQAESRNVIRVVKVQSPACPWEFYIIQAIHRRLQHSKIPIRSSIMTVDEAYFFDDGSCFVNELLPHGTLLDVVNLVFGSGVTFPESVMLYICIEMLRILEATMAIQMIHGDVKPDNYLFRGLPRTANLAGETQCLRLIDFGRGIDMRLFPVGTSFGVSVDTSGFQCIEMKTQRPWTYQTDMFGVAGTMHVLLFDAYMKVIHDGHRWKHTSKYTRWFKAARVVERVFDELLNNESCDKLADVGALRHQLEVHFTRHCRYDVDVKLVNPALLKK